MEEVWMPLKNAIDLHIHIGPDTVQRYYDCISLAKESLEKGMRAIILKDNPCSSVHKAILTNMIVPEINVFGGIVLNHTSGGLNIRSVLSALKMGGKIIWLPTSDAEYSIKKGEKGHWIQKITKRSSYGYKMEGITVLSKDKSIKKEVKDILKIVNDYNAILATGHISPTECLAVIDANENIGAKILVNHPNIWFDDFTNEILNLYVKGKATIEFTAGGITARHGQNDPEEIVSVINNIGYRNCCLSTDFGGIDQCSPSEGLRSFAYILNDCGVSKEKIEYMIKQKPAELLGLSSI
jgi:hypothetical protein